MEETYERLINGIKYYCETTNCKGFVIGISGGKDSTVVTKLLVDALGKDKVFGVLMPNGVQKDIADSYKICKFLDIDYQEVDIHYIYRELLQAIHNDCTQLDTAITMNHNTYSITEKAKTNILPRLRMTVLYAIAQSRGFRVCGTGNMSEHYIGWFTKWGDGACDFNPIAHLTCTEVIELGHYMGLPTELVDKTPSDGLTGKSDEENFGFTYKELDEFLRHPIQTSAEKAEKFIQMRNNSQHKTQVYEL